MDILDWKMRSELVSVYAGILADRSISAPAAEYAVELAICFFGEDLEKGKQFLQRPELFSSDPLKLTDDRELTAENVWKAQIKICLPLLEEERHCFITAEYGRLLPILGVDYWDTESNEYGILYKYDIGARIDEANDDALCLVGDVLDDPYGLSLMALSKLGYLEKRLNMLGTVSYTPFYHMNPEDRERLVFLADCQERLNSVQILSPDELNKLYEGHAAFMSRGE